MIVSSWTSAASWASGRAESARAIKARSIRQKAVESASATAACGAVTVNALPEAPGAAGAGVEDVADPAGCVEDGPLRRRSGHRPVAQRHRRGRAGETDPPGPAVRPAAEGAELAGLDQHLGQPLRSKQRRNAVGDVALRDPVEAERHAGTGEGHLGGAVAHIAPADPCASHGDGGGVGGVAPGIAPRPKSAQSGWMVGSNTPSVAACIAAQRPSSSSNSGGGSPSRPAAFRRISSRIWRDRD